MQYRAQAVLRPALRFDKTAEAWYTMFDCAFSGRRIR